MGRQKNKKQRRPRKDWTDLERAADAYQCGHCHSATGWAKFNNDDVGRVVIQHDDSCPVLAGTVSDLPDALRAAGATGGMVVLDAETGQHVTVYGDDEQKAAFVTALTSISSRSPRSPTDDAPSRHPQDPEKGT
ncbi:hypothetical protein GCM10010451_04890 [Streptomyces virens]|uniref:Uncharacterized protein n=1 Tax=Streptomyces virens TaxID=285572 RepID=A0ABP6NXR7_9ACTN|nr:MULTISPECIES: hypothetical protein [Streptomyces]MBA8975544.1 hypothetical protein [Streptomyces calvus]MYS27934.1 hypothetical protein [Streptomyces sp. SID7804]